MLVFCTDVSLSDVRISGQIFGLISSFLSNRWLQVVLDGKSSQEYSVNTGVPQGSILGPSFFLLYINDLPDNVICDLMQVKGPTSAKRRFKTQLTAFSL